jgi:predicted RNA-binding protein YlqC (UPF0109 family)
MPETEDAVVLLLHSIVRAIVDRPEDVQVEVQATEELTTLAVRVHPDDIRRLADRQGNNLLALRTVIRGAGIKRNREYKVAIAK